MTNKRLYAYSMAIGPSDAVEDFVPPETIEYVEYYSVLDVIDLPEGWDRVGLVGARVVTNRPIDMDTIEFAHVPEYIIDRTYEEDFDPDEIYTFPLHGVFSIEREEYADAEDYDEEKFYSVDGVLYHRH